MADDLGTETAKDRLRRVGEGVGVVSWLHEHPLTYVLVAAGIGGLAARVPRSKLITCLDMLLQVLPDRGSSKQPV